MVDNERRVVSSVEAAGFAFPSDQGHNHGGPLVKKGTHFPMPLFDLSAAHDISYRISPEMISVFNFVGLPK